jgi:hypothetical protein
MDLAQPITSQPPTPRHVASPRANAEDPAPVASLDHAAAPSQGPLPVGMTPLVQDRATRGHMAQCYFKIEGFQLGGHFSDRYAEPALAALLDPSRSPSAPTEVVLASLDRFAVSAAVQAASRWYPVKITIFYEQVGEGLRLRQLVSHAGVKLRRGTPQDAAAYVSQTPSAALLLAPTLCASAGELFAQELLEQLGVTPDLIILPSEGAALAPALAQRLDLPLTSVEVLDHTPTPGPDTIALAPIFSEVGRQGILLSPEGAAIVERARAASARLSQSQRAAIIIAVLPDGGSRYFGWTPGWSMDG